MTSLATAIITAPRPKPTLEHSMISYRIDGGFENTVRVFADGEVQPFRSDTLREWAGVISLNSHRLGNLRNWMQALTWLYEHTDDPWLMVCEDDITWAQNASAVLMEELSDWSQPRAGILSLYCPVRMSRVLESIYSPGSKLSRKWYGLTMGRKLWGAQCFILHRNEVGPLLNCGYLQKVLSDASKTINVDAHLAESMMLREKQIWYRIPCLVDHMLGDLNSSIYGDKDRPDLRTRYFEEFAR